MRVYRLLFFLSIILLFSFTNCTTSMLMEATEYKRFKDTSQISRKVKKFISSNTRTFMVIEVEEENFYANRSTIQERCFPIQDFKETSLELQITDYVKCPTVYEQLDDFKEIIREKDDKPTLFIQDTFAIVAQRVPKVDESWEGYPFYHDSYCECKDYPNYPVETVLGFRAHILVKFKNGTAYGLMATNAGKNISKEIKRPIGFLSAEEFNQFINDEACYGNGQRTVCNPNKTNKTLYGEQKIETFPPDYGRFTIQGYIGDDQKFSYSRTKSIFKKRYAHIKILEKITYTERKERPAYYLLLPLTLATDIVFLPLQALLFLLAINISH